MNDAHVLVTGGAGFIGSNLANALVEGNHVTVVDDCYLGTPDHLHEEVVFRERSVLEEDLPTDVDVVFHLAALSSYAMHERDPAQGARVNVEGFVNVVEQARRDGCDTIVYASSSSVYGSHADPASEDAEIHARTGYEGSKLARERYAEHYAHQYDMSLAGLRFYSVYQGMGGAESHKEQYANVIAQFAADIANGRSPEIYGDGSQTRDFTHVSDVVRALEAAGERSLDGVYNVGTGTACTFNDLVDRLNDELGRAVAPTYVENPIPDHVYVTHTCADASKIKEATGWTPRIDFDEGIRRVCAAHVPDV